MNKKFFGLLMVGLVFLTSLGGSGCMIGMVGMMKHDKNHGEQEPKISKKKAEKKCKKLGLKTGTEEFKGCLKAYQNPIH